MGRSGTGGFNSSILPREGWLQIRPATSGIYFIGWHVYSGGQDYDSKTLVDDITVSPVTAAPSCASGPSPSDGAAGVDVDADLSWNETAGATGYKVYFGTDNPPTTLLSDQPGSTADPGAMPFSATRYWQIVPYNLYGEASSCPVWSFTIQPDPTVTSFPYTENFDGVGAWTLPYGWTTADGATS